MSLRRLFIAVDISDEARSLAAGHIDKMRQHAKGVRVSWEKAEKLHVTLKFLGNVDDDRIAAVDRAVEKAARKFSPFEMTVRGTGVFPHGRQPRVLWLGIGNADETLPAVAAEIDRGMFELGFEREERKFNPHLTIARIREPQKAKRLAEAHLQSRFGSQPFSVSRLVVYESLLQPTGSIYRVVSTHSLESLHR